MTRPSPLFVRIGPYAALALLGFALVVAASTVEPGPRFTERDRLVDLIKKEDLRARILRDQLDSLQARIKGLEDEAVGGQRRLAALRADIDRLAQLAGTTPIHGPGVVVELTDSTLRQAPTGDPNDLVIHEQDLQAVVNALWGAGAEGIAINGERITSASAVRCVGNTLLLHGSVYAPPYVVEAVGDPAAIIDRMNTDPLIERFRIFAEDFRLGFTTRAADDLTLPAFRGVLPATVGGIVAG